MFRKLLILTLILSSGAYAKTQNNIQTVTGEGLHHIKVSMNDLNRITCSTEIGEPFYSKEKEIEVRKHDKNLFVKILPTQTVYSDGRTAINHSNIPREMYVECGGRFFSLVLLPDRNTQATQIVLNTPFEDSKVALATETASDYEKTMQDLVRAGFTGNIPAGYKVATGKNTKHFEEAALNLNKVYTGHLYIIEEWTVKSKLKFEKEFDEVAFIPLFKDVRAIALVNPLLLPEEETRLIVVRQNTTAER